MLYQTAQRLPQVHGHGARSAGFADARAPGYSRAQFCESASDEDVDVAGASAEHIPMDNSIMEYFPVDPEGNPHRSQCDSDIHDQLSGTDWNVSIAPLTNVSDRITKSMGI
jgi:hypothetical protein